MSIVIRPHGGVTLTLEGTTNDGTFVLGNGDTLTLEGAIPMHAMVSPEEALEALQKELEDARARIAELERNAPVFTARVMRTDFRVDTQEFTDMMGRRQIHAVTGEGELTMTMRLTGPVDHERVRRILEEDIAVTLASPGKPEPIAEQPVREEIQGAEAHTW
jgi:hypothetical protein